MGRPLSEAGFECLRCGGCCRGNGRVRLRSADIDALSALLGLSAKDFTARYAELDACRQGLILIDGLEGACVFLDADGSCRVHASKPLQCRRFPLRWQNPDSVRTCPGLWQAD